MQYFIDFNTETNCLNSKFELFTDDCHLTYNGNEFIAKKIIDKITANNILMNGNNF
jgi:hypothetical protein